jgi:hypothetical protein
MTMTHTPSRLRGHRSALKHSIRAIPMWRLAAGAMVAVGSASTRQRTFASPLGRKGERAGVMAGVSRFAAVSALVSVALVAPPAAAEPVVLGVGVQPGVAVDTAGTAYVAWLGGESSDNTLQFCRLPRGAAACDVRKAIPTPAGSNSLTRPFVHVDGPSVKVVQHRYGFETGAFNRLLLYRSSNGGTTFTAGPVIGTQGYADATFGPGNALSITGTDPSSGQFYQRQPLDGSAPATTDADLSTTHIYDGAVASFENRPVVVSSTLGSQGQVRRYTGAGDPNSILNWSAPIEIGTASYMRLAAGPLGLFQLATGPGNALEVRRFNGTTFGPGHALAQFAGPNTELVQDPAGRLHAFWFSGGSDGLSTSYAISDDGANWQTGELRIETQGGWDDPDAAIAPDHVGALVWAGSTATQPNVIKLHSVGPAPPAPPIQDPPLGPIPPPTDTRPAPTLPSARNLHARAHRRGSKVTITLRSRLRLPPSLSRVEACQGRIAIKIKRRRRTLATRRTSINSLCGFRATIRLPASKLRGVRRLGIALRFPGNSILGPAAKRYTVRLNRG